MMHTCVVGRRAVLVPSIVRLIDVKMSALVIRWLAVEDVGVHIAVVVQGQQARG
jgi:hypothetical protein